ncbi:MAG TPA: C4-type zinc ribbon domain-containing protein [Candidatus Acidoferrales bacterium]|nr:C4-type zinc ribbon domain-containing protein [Candidatus Acidoferrales bacterium]
MQSAIRPLLDLQRVDTTLHGLRQKLAAFPGRAAEIDARLSAAKGKLNTAREALTTSAKDRKKFELDVEQWRERARKYRDQSYEVKTNEAFKALQHEIAHAEKEMASAEDRLLERMVSGEDFDRQVKAAEAELKQAETAAAAEHATLAADKSQIEKQVAAAESERAEIVKGIPEKLLDEYERIARRHHGVALAEVRNETCQACGVRVRPHVFQALRRAEEGQLFTCETCNRILYAAEPVAPAQLNGGPTSGSAGARPASESRKASSEVSSDDGAASNDSVARSSAAGAATSHDA